MSTPKSFFAMPVRWTGGALNATVTENGTVASVSLLPSGTHWTRTYLAPNSGGTSEQSPRDLIRWVRDSLNGGNPGSNRWAVTLGTDARVRIRYNGPGTGLIVWGATLPIAYALGFAADISLASGATQIAAYMPAFCWVPRSTAQDVGVTVFKPAQSSALLASGEEIVLSETARMQLRRQFAARFAPADEARRAQMSASATPFWPTNNTRLFTPSGIPENVGTAWTVHEFLSTAPGRLCAGAFYNLQQIISGSNTEYWECYLLAQSVRDGRNRVSVQSYTSLVDCDPVEFSLMQLTALI